MAWIGFIPKTSFECGISEFIKHGSEGFIMDSYNSKYNYKDFQMIFEDLDTLKVCSMNIFNDHSYDQKEYC